MTLNGEIFTFHRGPDGKEIYATIAVADEHGARVPRRIGPLGRAGLLRNIADIARMLAQDEERADR